MSSKICFVLGCLQASLFLFQLDKDPRLRTNSGLFVLKGFATADGGMLDLMQNNNNNTGKHGNRSNDVHNHCNQAKPRGDIVNASSIALEWSLVACRLYSSYR